MKIDRSLQKEMLMRLRDKYAEPDTELLKHFGDGGTDRLMHVISNTLYLAEHGLVDSDLFVDEEGYRFTYAKITAKGCDFLEGDGGLSAILGVVTIRIHDDSVKAMIEGHVIGSDLSPQDKRRYLDQLHELPAETTKHLVLKLVDLALAKSPQAIDVIGKWLF
jgi:hypothetical protein